MAAPLNTCTTLEQRGVVQFVWAKDMAAKDIHKEMLPMLQDGGAPEYVYHDRRAWCCAVFVGKRYGSKGYQQRNAAHVR